MQKIRKQLTFFMLCACITAASSQIVVSGYIEDATSGEKLAGATLYNNKTKSGAVANNFGFYSLTVSKDSVDLVASFVGYAPLSIKARFERDTFIVLTLKPADDLQTVEISATKQDRIENRLQMSQTTLSVEQIKKIPVLLGEVDILKALQLLPGIKFGNEGTNGLYVRGGGADQNLILLDGVPVYNASHIGGLFSVFNADAIKSVRVTTGGFPARFGGRLSSIIEIDMKEGNNKTWHGEAGIGIIASRLLLEGPIVKDKISCMFSIRRTYADWILKQTLKSEYEASGGVLEKYALYFYDLNGKINYKINNKHRLFLSAYTGLDRNRERVTYKTQDMTNRLSYIGDGTNQWGNLTAALRWNWAVSNKLFVNTMITRSNYFFNINNSTETPFENSAKFTVDKFDYTSRISDWTVKSDADYILNTTHHLRFGVGSSFYKFQPGTYQLYQLQPNEKRVLTPFDTTYGNPSIRSVAPFVYAEDEVNLGRLVANIGLHGTSYFVENTIYPSLQPRLSMLYRLNASSSLKASFSTMRQFVNLLTNDGLGFPTDLWVSSTRRLLPQKSWLAAIGFAKSYGDDYEMSIETYYKDMKNVLSYREGAEFIDAVDLKPWQDKVTQGTGNAYGLELFLKKKTGKLTGWASYTLSWNNRRFADINNGKTFPFRYDRRHELSLVGSYQLTKRISLSSNFVFATSNPITPPIGVFFYPAFGTNSNLISGSGTVIVYGDRNSFRPTIYHRLDASIDFTRKRAHFERRWSIGVFNVYNRANPFYFELKAQNAGYSSTFPVTLVTSKYTLQQISLIPILPSVSYNIKW
jgi:outer membrane receptor for ferrienterochelin and colicin